jgi:hypothetical protein
MAARNPALTGGFDVHVLDDGALRFIRPNGEPVQRETPGFHRPPGDPSALPVGKLTACWRGDRMDMNIAVELLIQKSQKSQKARDVPAGT